MPRPRLHLPENEADAFLQEVIVRAEAKKQDIGRTYNPTLAASKEEAKRKLAEMRADVGLYGEYVFGLKPARVHRMWNQVADDVINRRIPQNKVLFLAPPNTAKSTWNSLIRPTHYLGNHPDHNLLFFTSSDPMANNFHRAVESIFRDNDRYREVFPDDANRPDRKRGWSTDGLYLQGTPPISKDGAYRAVGFGASVMGARAHGILIDDPMNQEQAKSPAEQQRAKDYSIQTVMRRLQPDIGWVIAVMTRFHENDLASHYIELAERDAGWLVIRTPMVATNDPEPDPMGRSTGELIWPEYLSPQFVKNTQAEMSIGDWELVYQCNPVGQGGDIFESEGWFQPLPANFWSEVMPNCRLLQFWDLAFSEKKKTCFTVGMTVAIDSSLNIYILHLVRKRMNTGDAEDEIVRIIQITRPMVVGIETDKFHQQLIISMARRILDRVMCNLQLVAPKDDKISRARLPASRAQAGKVFIDKNAPWYRAFVTECLGFPNQRYKDQVDAFSGVVLMAERLEDVIRTSKRIDVETSMAS